MTSLLRSRLARLPIALGLALALVGAVPVAAHAAYAYKPTAGLKAYDKTNASITLTWTRQSGINRYAIQYSTSSKFTSPKYRVPSSVTSQDRAYAAVRDLQPSTKYYFRIRATYADGSNASDWSKAISVTTSSYAFAAPSTPKASNVLTTSLDLTWGIVPNAGQYRVRYSTSSSFASNVAYAYSPTTSAKLTGLQPGVKYYVQVRALESKTDDNGDPYLLTAYSSTLTVTTASTFTAAPPADLEVVGSSKDKIVLRWTPTAGATGYRVQTTYGSTKRYLQSSAIPAGAGSFATSGGKVTATLAKFCDSNGTCSAYAPGKSYAFAVTAMSGDTRISDYTGKVTAVATALPLAAPRAFELASVTSGSVTLRWEKVAGATSYRIQQKKGTTSGETRYLYDVCGSSSPVPCSVNGDTVTATLSVFADNNTGKTNALTANATHHYKVSAQANVAGAVSDTLPQFEDRASEYVTSFVKGTTAQYAMTAPALQTKSREATAITLGWARTPGANAFIIERSKDTEFKTLDFTSCVDTTVLGADPINPAGGTQWQRRYYNLSDETTYFFRLRIVNNCTSKATLSSNSAPISARTTAGTGTVTGKVVASDDGVNLPAALATMTATAYAYQDGQTGSDQEVAGTARVKTDGTYAITGLRPGRYRVQLSQIGGAASTSPWVSSATAASQWDDESHKFQAKSGVYQVAQGGSTAVHDTPVGKGVTLSGAVSRVVGGAAVKDVTVTAIGAPTAASDATREVRDVTTTLADGSYAFTGLFPGKYKITLVKSGTLRSSSFWVSPVQAHPSIDAGVCGSAETTCVPTPSSNQYNNAPG